MAPWSLASSDHRAHYGSGHLARCPRACPSWRVLKRPDRDGHVTALAVFLPVSAWPAGLALSARHPVELASLDPQPVLDLLGSQGREQHPAARVGVGSAVLGEQVAAVLASEALRPGANCVARWRT